MKIQLRICWCYNISKEWEKECATFFRSWSGSFLWKGQGGGHTPFWGERLGMEAAPEFEEHVKLYTQTDRHTRAHTHTHTKAMSAHNSTKNTLRI